MLDQNVPKEQFIILIQQTIRKAINEALEPILSEMSQLKKLMKNVTDPIQNVPNISSTPSWPTQRSQGAISKVVKGDKTVNEKALDLANRCVGLGPITDDTVSQQIKNTNSELDNYTRSQIGGAFAVRDFLCREMDMSDTEVDNLRIIRTFRLKEQDSDLYVEFGSESNLRKVRSYVTNLSTGTDQDPRLTTFVPKHLQPQFSRLVTRANRGRAQIPKQSSKIWLGVKGFELRFRPKGSFIPWNKIEPESDIDNNIPVVRQSEISKRSQPINHKEPSTAHTNDTWLFQKSNSPSASPMNRFNNHSTNPNLIPVTKGRRNNNLVGEPLLPRDIRTRNRFDPLQGTSQSDP